MQITREADYAIRCMICLAQEPGRNITVRELARRMKIPRSFLAKLVQKLVRAGLLQSEKGVQGGFRPARKPAEINLLQVVEAVQGPLNINICVMNRKACPQSGSCSVHTVWSDIQEVIKKKLAHNNLKKLTGSASRKGANGSSKKSARQA